MWSNEEKAEVPHYHKIWKIKGECNAKAMGNPVPCPPIVLLVCTGGTGQTDIEQRSFATSFKIHETFTLYFKTQHWTQNKLLKSCSTEYPNICKLLIPCF